MPRRAERVIRGIPAGSAARRGQPGGAAPSVPLRAAGETLEIAAGDLALDTAGTEQVFAASDASVSHEAAAEVTRRTEGWPVGINLTCLIARDEPARRCDHGGRPLRRGLPPARGVPQLPEATRRFLRRTAVLDDLSAPLCDAVLGEHTSQLSCGSSKPRACSSSRSTGAGVVRYHALFREFLLAELMSVEPELADVLRVRAARVRLHLARTSWRRPTSPPSGACCARSTTCSCAAHGSARSPTRSPSCQGPRHEHAHDRHRLLDRPAHTRRAAASAVPADTPDDPGDRGAAVRLAQYGQLGDRGHLPQARRLVAQRRRAPGRRDGPAGRRVNRHGELHGEPP